MADEISVSVSMSLQNGNLYESYSSSGTYDQTSAVSSGGVVKIGTSTETVSLGDVETAGYAAFRSLSTATAGTAYVAIGHYDGTNLHEFAQLQRGDVIGPVRLAPSITLGMIAYTATDYTSDIGVQYLVLGE
jgi:hypothetical protein